MNDLSAEDPSSLIDLLRALYECESMLDAVTKLRSPDDERYDAVGSVLAGSRVGVERISMRPGALMLFEGRRSMHRVTPVAGTRSRYVALLADDTQPDRDSSKLLKLVRYGRLPS